MKLIGEMRRLLWIVFALYVSTLYFAWLGASRYTDYIYQQFLLQGRGDPNMIDEGGAYSQSVGGSSYMIYFLWFGIVCIINILGPVYFHRRLLAKGVHSESHDEL